MAVANGGAPSYAALAELRELARALRVLDLPHRLPLGGGARPPVHTKLRSAITGAARLPCSTQEFAVWSTAQYLQLLHSTVEHCTVQEPCAELPWKRGRADAERPWG